MIHLRNWIQSHNMHCCLGRTQQQCGGLKTLYTKKHFLCQNAKRNIICWRWEKRRIVCKTWKEESFMLPSDLKKKYSRFSWYYYKTKIRNWLWSITRVNPIAWCGNPEGLGTTQHNSRRRFTSLFYSTKYTSSSKVSVFDKWFRARNEAEKWSFLKIWALEKKEVLETTKRGGVLVFTGQFYLQTCTTEALRHQQTENKWFRNIPERSGI